MFRNLGKNCTRKQKMHEKEPSKMGRNKEKIGNNSRSLGQRC